MYSKIVERLIDKYIKYIYKHYKSGTLSNLSPVSHYFFNSEVDNQLILKYHGLKCNFHIP